MTTTEADNTSTERAFLNRPAVLEEGRNLLVALQSFYFTLYPDNSPKENVNKALGTYRAIVTIAVNDLRIPPKPAHQP